jgi:hypothetical protein
VADSLRAGLDIRDRRLKKTPYIKYDSCFTGSDATQLIFARFGHNEAEALTIGNKLLQMNVFSHVSGKMPFLNSSNLYYRFNSDANSLKANVKHQERVRRAQTGPLVAPYAFMTQRFIDLFDAGQLLYFDGDWGQARQRFEAALGEHVDPVASNLLEFMRKHEFKAPDDWQGFRDLWKE